LGPPLPMALGEMYLLLAALYHRPRSLSNPGSGMAGLWR
jgi:hypothetical protein